MDDLLREFLTETSENIATLDAEIVRLEQNPEDPELIGSIFRLVHTIKGTCGFLGLPRLEHLAHAGENVLGKFRDRELPVTPAAVDLILKSFDRIKTLLAHLEQHQAEAEGSDQDLITSLNQTAESKTAAHPTPSEVLAAIAAPDEFSFTPVPAVQTAAINITPPTLTNPTPKPVTKPADETAKSSVADQSIRVNIDQLETLMTTVSELVLTRNQLLQILRGQKDSAFVAPLQRLNQVTSELQEGVMKTRMQPIGNAWAKLPRIIRDLAHELNKKIDLQMLGADTELDRQVLELIKDPLTHMVRNSADHGIELPQDRASAGKTETGTVLLNAYHEGGHIVIDISDDGRGLALDKIRAKIIEKTLASEAELATMSDQQIMQFIFKPGFSTAAQVTSVSGRGVGMDVVKTNIERIGGTVDFKSTPGKGSIFSIKIPLTLAIVSALIVEAGGERFAVPQISVIELVKTSPTSEHRVELINDTPVLRLRNRLLPLVSLRKRLKLGDGDIRPDEAAFIVVVQIGNATLGVIVDRVFDTEEIVVKPVARVLRNIDIFSGNTILGDGSVIMILDLNAVVSAVGDNAAHNLHAAAPALQVAYSEAKQSLLLFRAGPGAQKAVPLALVARLEEIDASAIEYSNGNPVFQYRGKLMPLIAAGPDVTIAGKGKQPILVFADKDQYMGLIVDKILDIVEEHLQTDLKSSRPGILGTPIVAGKATDILDASFYLQQTAQCWFGENDGAYQVEKLRRILLVDDSLFFRNLLMPILAVAGYEVTSVEDALSALKLQDDGLQFDAIVSDIEMPGMNGYDFVEKLRQGNGNWSNLPVLAMSSHATPKDVERGLQAGFTEYVAKYNREGLLSALSHTIKARDVRKAS